MNTFFIKVKKENKHALLVKFHSLNDDPPGLLCFYKIKAESCLKSLKSRGERKIMWLKHNQTDYKNTKQSGFKDENQCWKKKKRKRKE
jgi:hypothetical protein